MTAFELAIAIYLAIGFAKFVLDISQIHILYWIVTNLEAELCEELDKQPTPVIRRWALSIFSIVVQTFLFWPLILYNVGLLEFLLPVTEERLRRDFSHDDCGEVEDDH